MRKFSFLYCFLFILNAHASTFDCFQALGPTVTKQKAADGLSQAIVEGDFKKIEELARPLLAQDRDYVLRYVDGFNRVAHENAVGVTNAPAIISLSIKKKRKMNMYFVYSVMSLGLLQSYDLFYNNIIDNDLLIPAAIILLFGAMLYPSANDDVIELGGRTIQIKVATVKGTGKLLFGEQSMSARSNDAWKATKIVWKYIKKYHDHLGISSEYLNNHNIVMHHTSNFEPVPQEAQRQSMLSRITKKTFYRSRVSFGSGSLSAFVAMVSSITNKPVKNNMSMTGEVDSSGRVLAVGGLEYKILNALRNGHKIIIPKDNKNDRFLPEALKNNPNVIAVSSIEEALDIALENDQVEQQFNTNDLLLFAAHVAANNSTANSGTENESIQNLKMLVEMGFDISIENESDKKQWAEFFWSYIGRSETLNQRQKQILAILIDAGLTFEKLYLDDGESLVHQSLLIGSSDKFKTILNSGLITQDNVDIKFYPRDFDSQRTYLGTNYDNTKTTLLHWISAEKKNDQIQNDLSPLIAMGADLDVMIDVVDEENVYSPMGRTPLHTAHKANNYIAVIGLLKAGANRDGFDINAKASFDNDLTLLQQAWYDYFYQDILYNTSFGKEYIEALINLGSLLKI